MRNIWAVTMHTLTEAHSRKISLPFLVAALLGVLVIIGGFGIFLIPNQYANNIISGFFLFWSWGTILTALCLGAASIPIERQSETLFTLPIHRWELLAGKLLGNWILVTVMHILGYVISVALAFHNHLPVTVYSIVALLTAIAASFGFLCLSVPLGMRLSAVEAGTMTVLVLYSLFVAVF